MDRLTDILSIITNNILISHPLRTSLGVLLGVVIYGTLEILAEPLSSSYPQVDLSKLDWVYCVAIGLLILHIRTLLKLLFMPRSMELDENTQTALAMIEKAGKEGHLSKRQEKEMYLEVIHKVINNREFKPGAGQQVPE